MPPLIFVVRRGAFERFRQLESNFAPEDAEVIWDRRLVERRAPPIAATAAPDRRRRDRRGVAPPSWTTLDFVTVSAGGATPSP